MQDFIIGVVALVFAVVFVFDEATGLLGNALEPCDQWRCDAAQVQAWHKERGTDYLESENYRAYAQY